MNHAQDHVQRQALFEAVDVLQAKQRQIAATCFTSRQFELGTTPLKLEACGCHDVIEDVFNADRGWPNWRHTTQPARGMPCDES